jgi:formate C-acetyltransferase
MDRDQIDATNHWLQNIVVGGLTPAGEDGTNDLTYLLLESYRRNQMTNPLLAVRLHRASPEQLVRYTCEVLKEGGGMPALFNAEEVIPALERMGIPTADARDYTNDGCWETIIPGRTDFGFQRLSLMFCLEWALNRGASRQPGPAHGIATGDPRAFATFEDVWAAFAAQLDAMVAEVSSHVVEHVDDRSKIAPVPLLSALIAGSIEARRDMTAGGARYRTFGMLAEGAAYAIDSLLAIQQVIFERGEATMAELCDALDADFAGHEALRARCWRRPSTATTIPPPTPWAAGGRSVHRHRGALRRTVSPHHRVSLRCGHLFLVHRYRRGPGRLTRWAARRRAGVIQLFAGPGP